VPLACQRRAMIGRKYQTFVGKYVAAILGIDAAGEILANVSTLRVIDMMRCCHAFRTSRSIQMQNRYLVRRQQCGGATY
jgi:hypothetical protein